MENQICHPSCSIKNSTQRPEENDDKPPTVAPANTTTTTTTANNQRHNPRLSSDKSGKRYRAVDTMANTLPPSKKSKTTPPPSASSRFTELPLEIRIVILHHALASAAGPNATISTHPRSKNLPKPPAGPAMLLFYGPQQTQWHARRGLLHASSNLRAETLQVLYGKFGFFTRMPLNSDPGFDGKGRFERWLEALGDEERIGMVRRVVFRVEWPAVRIPGSMKWFRGRTEVEVCVFKGKWRVMAKVEMARAMWMQKEEETPWLHLEDVEDVIEGMLSSKGGLGRQEWMNVWEKVEEVMKLQWFWSEAWEAGAAVRPRL